MRTIESLYKLLGVPPTCSDDELRHAYFRALLENHADKSPNNAQVGNTKAQEITIAYVKLKEYRDNFEDDLNDWQTIIDDDEFTIDFSFESRISVDDIAQRKSNFQRNFKRFKENSSDPVSALRLIYSAFSAGRSDAIKELLTNQILIDSATILLSIADEESACGTYLKWADLLRANSRSKEAIQLLEAVHATGLEDSFGIDNELRNLHYAWAQYIDPTTGSKATPDVRIEHLNRIIDLGFNNDYIYKFLAEAHYDLGDIEQAKIYLKQAYEINPALIGAKKISRVLGFLQPESSPKTKNNTSSQYKWSRPQQIPTATQIYELAKNENWSSIIEFSDPNQYSPKIISKARQVFDLMADLLGRYSDTKSIEALTTMINNIVYWDVKITAISALSKIGDINTYDFLRQQVMTNDYSKEHLRICLSYLKTRLDKDFVGKLAVTPHDNLLVQVKQNYKKKEYGKARVILEYLVEMVEPTHISYIEIKILLALTCAEMGDPSTSIELIEPIFRNLSKELREEISLDFDSWIYRILMSQGYFAAKDKQYQFGLGILLEHSLAAKNPDKILDNLKTITRWLEQLGVSDLTQWIRQLIRVEAPGSGYTDDHDRINYILRDVVLSENMKRFLSSFENQIKSSVAPKLKEML